MKIIFVSDFFLKDVVGGGEICDDCIIEYLKKNNQIEKIESSSLTLNKITSLKNYIFIISNFALIQPEVLFYITNNINYIIYEHDYKFLSSRNPAKFINFKAPEKEIINKKFYSKAKKIICQSDFQKQIFEKNLKLSNIMSIGTNFWLDEHYKILEEKSNIDKKDKYAILDTNIPNKNTMGAIEYCKKNNINFELIPYLEYNEFLSIFSCYKGFIFLPQSPETFSRTVMEARMMNMEVITNNLIGCKKEDWYLNYKGKDLIKLMKTKNEEAYRLFESLL